MAMFAAADGAQNQPHFTNQRLNTADMPDLNRLRAKYAPNISASAGSSMVGGPTPASITLAAQQRLKTSKQSQKQYSPEEIEAFSRLDRVKICPACGGQATQRQHFNHYYVDVDCPDCDGEGYIKRADPAELVVKAQALKDEATALFKSGDVKGADERFDDALKFVVQFAAVGTNAATMRSSLIANRAACALKLEDWDACIEHCDRILSQDKKNVKALWRKSQALLKKSETQISKGNGVPGDSDETDDPSVAQNINSALEEARKLLTQMLEVEPNHSKAVAALTKLSAGTKV